TSGGQGLLRITRQTVRFIDKLVWQPLMMNARCINRLLDIHVEIDDVGNYVQHRVDDRRTAGTADGEPKRAVFAQDECRCHRRQGPFAWCDRVALALDQTIEIWR